jgi:hypothetical protein
MLICTIMRERTLGKQGKGRLPLGYVRTSLSTLTAYQNMDGLTGQTLCLVKLCSLELCQAQGSVKPFYIAARLFPKNCGSAAVLATALSHQIVWLRKRCGNQKWPKKSKFCNSVVNKQLRRGLRNRHFLLWQWNRIK